MTRTALITIALLLAHTAAAQEPAQPAPKAPAPAAQTPGGKGGTGLEATAPAVAGLTLAECVARAVADSGQVAEAKGKVAEWQARLDEVKSVWWPKLSGTAVAAPIFKVKGSVLDPNVESDWTHWGPYLRLDALLVQPIYTFGRSGAGEQAARERVEVERAQYELTRRRVALEVTRYYHLYLYARSVGPTLDTVRKMLDDAQSKGQELFEAHTGGVTTVDLMKLRYYSAELDKYRVQAEIGADVALAALKHTMGLAEEAPLVIAAAALPEDDGAPLPPLDAQVGLAMERRPETAQLRHGRKAAEELAKAEGKGDLPVLALVGQLSLSWSPVREDAQSPYIYDPYNERTGGVGLALQFDVDPAKTMARERGARSMVDQVDGLAKYAATGIPVEVRKALGDLAQARKLAALSKDGSAAARKWMILAASDYAAGTGETRELLDGMAAFANARKGYFDALLALHLARANLDAATGAPLPGAR